MLVNELRNSRRNRTDHIPSSAAVAACLHFFAIRYWFVRTQRGERGPSAKDLETYKRHAEIVLLDLLAAYDGDPTKYIGYSRGKDNFIRGGSYWDANRDVALVNERPFINLIDFLAEEGHIENRVKQPGFGRYSSRMRATPQLADFFRREGLNWASAKSNPDAPVIIVRDENKKPIPLPSPGNFDLEAAEASLRRINANLQSTFINLNVTDAEHEEIKRRMAGDEADADEAREPLEFSNRSLRRIFLLGGYENGGRFYGGWWQGLPSEYRKFIEIQGAVTVEMDYSTMQPRIMYAQTGQEPPKDSYIPPGWPAEVRTIAKKLFSQLINSDRSSRNENQWHRFAPDIDLDYPPLVWGEMPEPTRNKVRREEFERIYGRPYPDLIRDLLAMHVPIDDSFFSKAWGRMQRIDSDIAERVMIKLLDEDVPITALPIHDSFIVRRGAEQSLQNAMSEAFFEVVGKPAKVDRDDTVYDPPESHEFEPLVMMRDLHDQVIADIQERKGCNRREAEWKRQYGNID